MDHLAFAWKLARDLLHVVSLNKHKLGAKLQGRGPGQNFMRYMVSRTPFLWLTAFCGTHLLSAQGGDAPPVSNFPATSAQPSAHTTAAPALLSTNAAPDITSELQQAANDGLPWACHNLGLKYFEKKQYEEALRWYTRAAGQGLSLAQANVGFLYERGLGVTADLTQAVRWYTRAAAQGHASAQYNLGQLYFNALGFSQVAEVDPVTRDILPQAPRLTAIAPPTIDPLDLRKWRQRLPQLEEEAKKGSAFHKYLLGQLFYFGHIVRQNYPEAARLWREAADTGHPLARHNLAWLLVHGRGLKFDLDEAAAWYHRLALDYLNLAARQQVIEAWFALGRLHSLPYGKPDYAKAKEWFEKAIDAGHADSNYALAGMHHHGLGVGRNYPKAARLYEEAARRAPDQWHPEAYYNLGYLYDQRLAERRSNFMAFRHYRTAALQGHKHAQYYLGLYFYEGRNLGHRLILSHDPNQPPKTGDLRKTLGNIAKAFGPALIDVFRTRTELFLPRAMDPRELQQLRRAFATNSLRPLMQERFSGDPGPGMRERLLYTLPGPPPVSPSELAGHLADRDRELFRAKVTLEPGLSGQSLLQITLPVGLDHLVRPLVAQHIPAATNSPAAWHLLGADLLEAQAWWFLAATSDPRHGRNGIEQARHGLTILSRTLNGRQKLAAARVLATRQARVTEPPAIGFQLLKAGEKDFAADTWGTGFFVTDDGYVVVSRHLIRPKAQYRVRTETGLFNATVVPLPGQQEHFGLLKVEGRFQPLVLASSHGMKNGDELLTLGFAAGFNRPSSPTSVVTHVASVLGNQADPRFFTLAHAALGDHLLMNFHHYPDGRDNNASLPSPSPKPFLSTLRTALENRRKPLGRARLALGYRVTAPLWKSSATQSWRTTPPAPGVMPEYRKGEFMSVNEPAPPVEARIPGRVLRVLASPDWGPEIEATLAAAFPNGGWKQEAYTPGLSGVALVNTAGRAVGVHFPVQDEVLSTTSAGILPNLSTFDRYVMKADRLIAVLSAVPVIKAKLDAARAEPAVVLSRPQRLARARAGVALVLVSD